nr:MAG TPA: hypothetical protein [Bacteriophage sp.]
MKMMVRCKFSVKKLKTIFILGNRGIVNLVLGLKYLMLEAI